MEKRKIVSAQDKLLMVNVPLRRKLKEDMRHNMFSLEKLFTVYLWHISYCRSVFPNLFFFLKH